jgi:putative zinc finger protein
MDCTNACLLMSFVRSGEIDAVEQEALETHLSGCPDCRGLAASESRFDDCLGAAMPRVPVPAGLKARIYQKLARRRRPKRWHWVAAALLLLAAGLGGYLAFMSSPEEFDPSTFQITTDNDSAMPPEAVEAKFLAMGITMKTPREFNYQLLDGSEVVELQGRRVPMLRFYTRAGNQGALAHVYALSTQQFKLPANLEEQAEKKDGWLSEIIPASSHNIQLRKYPGIADFFYLVVYTSGSLDPFTLNGI